MPEKIIQMMTFTQIMAIWTPATTLYDHIKALITGHPYVQLRGFEKSQTALCVTHILDQFYPNLSPEEKRSGFFLHLICGRQD